MTIIAIPPHIHEALVEPDRETGHMIATREMREWMDNINTSNIVEIGATDTTYTTDGTESVIICNNTSTATITLNVNPSNGETVAIKRRSALVNFTGTIDGSPTESLALIYDSYRLIYTTVTGEWSKI
jgi:hypothetical protein